MEGCAFQWGFSCYFCFEASLTRMSGSLPSPQAVHWGTDYLAVIGGGGLCSFCLVVRSGDEEMMKEEASLAVGRDLQKHSHECIHGICTRERCCYPNVKNPHLRAFSHTNPDS